MKNDQEDDDLEKITKASVSLEGKDYMDIDRGRLLLQPIRSDRTHQWGTILRVTLAIEHDLDNNTSCSTKLDPNACGGRSCNRNRRRSRVCPTKPQED